MESHVFRNILKLEEVAQEPYSYNMVRGRDPHPERLFVFLRG